jgi:competence protein ComEA
VLAAARTFSLSGRGGGRIRAVCVVPARPAQEEWNMKHRIGKTGLIALALFFVTGASSASTTPSATAAKPAASSAAKPAVKLVDINSASKAELKTLPGIDDARAAKIIAGRPYGSKAFLVERNIIPIGVYEQIKKQIIAKQK